ncbi:MAG TPA: multicopper oxidase family protein [Nocardioidaceae bacterium]|nr:multicopper oxidase family protein [Nocardioidaceae bacterium]
MRRHLRAILACLATAAIVVPLGWLWWSSLMPDEYSVMDMGYVDLGGGVQPAAGTDHGEGQAGHDGHVDISTLVAEDDGPADVQLDLTAREETFTLASGREVSGYTLNGSSPGPTLRAVEGEVVEVRLTNENIPEGITLHWHGIDVPNAMDGVAGVTQDSVLEGETFTYRYVAEQVGTYWYHSHQVSHEQVRRGLFGAVVVEPAGGVRSTSGEGDVLDVEAMVHQYGGARTVNGQEGDIAVPAEPGRVVRVRVTNTDNGPMTIWVSGAPYKVVAVDGHEVNGPDEVEDMALVVTAGGRSDLEIVVPEVGARVELAGNAIVLGPEGSSPAAEDAPVEFVDMLSYGEKGSGDLDPAQADRRFEYVIGRAPGFLKGRPGLWWTINGHRWPDVPMYTVEAGDVVTMRIANESGEVHPMHLHGHHAWVMSRNGEDATGSPWWVDSLNVRDGETYEIAFVADNPGLWMDHCHNLPHAAEGLVAHLMYAGYTTPFMVGGDHDNEPE